MRAFEATDTPASGAASAMVEPAGELATVLDRYVEDPSRVSEQLGGTLLSGEIIAFHDMARLAISVAEAFGNPHAARGQNAHSELLDMRPIDTGP